MDFKKHFSTITDPRDERKITHLLTDIIGLSVIATIAGCEGYEDIEYFGKEKESWLRTYRELPNGIPSHDTIEKDHGQIRGAHLLCYQRFTVCR